MTVFLAWARDWDQFECVLGVYATEELARRRCHDDRGSWKRTWVVAREVIQ